MWFYFALATALLRSLSTIYNKQVLKNTFPEVLTFALSTLTLPFLLVIVLSQGMPTLTSFFFAGIFGSATFYVFSKNLTLSSIKHGDLSNLAPLESIGIFFTYIFGLFLLSESISSQGTIGLLLIIIGTYILHLNLRNQGFFEPFKILVEQKISRYYIIGVLLGSIIVIFDKVSLINMAPPSPAFLLLCQNLVISPIMFIYLIRKRPKWANDFKSNFFSLLIASIIYGLFILAAFSGFSRGPVTLTVAIIQLNILITMLFSYIFFQDKPTKYNILGALVMLLGVVLIKSG